MIKLLSNWGLKAVSLFTSSQTKTVLAGLEKLSGYTKTKIDDKAIKDLQSAYEFISAADTSNEGMSRDEVAQVVNEAQGKLKGVSSIYDTKKKEFLLSNDRGLSLSWNPENGSGKISGKLAGVGVNYDTSDGSIKFENGEMA